MVGRPWTGDRNQCARRFQNYKCIVIYVRGRLYGMELKHAILGLLSARSVSGYDLARALADSVAQREETA